MAIQPSTKASSARRRSQRIGNSHEANDKPAAVGDGDRRALVIGINDYPGTVNDLPSCVSDAQSMATLLRESYGFNSITLLVDADATVANVTQELTKLFSGVTAKSRVVFYFSGHGSTDRRANTIEECIVLHDGYLFDDKLVELSRKAPAGTTTVILDSCYSGGMEKQLLQAVFKSNDEVERARVKAYLREDPKDFDKHTDDQEEIANVIAFGGQTFVPRISRVKDVISKLSTGKALIPAPASDEIGQEQLNGLLLSACLETETAAASTSVTGGKSAFTFALLEVLKSGRLRASSNDIIEGVQQKLKGLGFRQTPLIKEPIAPAKLGQKSFITFEEAKQAISTTSISPADSIANIISSALNQNNGVNIMDPATLIQIISALSKNDQLPPQKGLGDLLPIILPLILKSGSNGSGSSKGLIDILPVILPALMKNSNGHQEKLFGIDDAIIIPALASVISAAVSKSAPPPQEKFFGIDDAILIPAVVSLASAAIRRL